MRVGNPIALIESKNSGNVKTMSDDAMGNLLTSLYLCAGASVMLARNYLNIGLTNGSNSIVKEIMFKSGTSLPALPKFALVDFGSSSTGYSFFPQ